MATLPTQLGNSPYIGWQNRFCKRLDFYNFSAIVFVYKFFYKFFLQVLLQRFPYFVAVERLVMETVIQHFICSLIHELNNS
jgi:hypothetical protein